MGKPILAGIFGVCHFPQAFFGGRGAEAGGGGVSLNMLILWCFLYKNYSNILVNA